MSETKNSMLEADVRSNWTGSHAPAAGAHVRVFYVAWYVVNILLVVSVIFAIYAFGWEFSTRRYLKGFSDAIVPASAPPVEKIESVLAWMAHGPARLPYGPSPNVPDRDPTDTLNYDALLRVCGTATNAFINLMDTGDVPVRRLLLVDAKQNTKHVVAEVLVDRRWIIVDPAYRLIMRDNKGDTLTREQLTNPVTFNAVTAKIPRYDPNYTFDRSEHVRVARLRVFGMSLHEMLDRFVPTWGDSTVVTLLVERESFAAVVTTTLLVVLLFLARVSLRWFGEHRLALRLVRLRHQLQRSINAFYSP